MIFLALLLFFSASVRNAYLDSFLRIARTSSDACKSCAPERYGRHSKNAPDANAANAVDGNERKRGAL